MAAEARTGQYIDVDLRVYRLEAVKKCAYRLSDVWQIAVEMTGPAAAVVRYTPLRNSVDIESFAQVFWPELIDQEMRCVVQGKTSGLKNLILAQAYAPVSLLSDGTGDLRS